MLQVMYHELKLMSPDSRSVGNTTMTAFMTQSCSLDSDSKPFATSPSYELRLALVGH